MHEPWYKDWNTAASPLAGRIARGVASSVTLYAEPTEGEDGLATVSIAEASEAESVLDALPVSLRTFLTDLRLLRNVPLAYLVPDPALLPPESIRFFHVNPNWVDRVIDGALAAANLGTLDMAFSLNMMYTIRRLLDDELRGRANEEYQKLKPDTDSSYGWDGTMTGLLLRSELVERWPKLEVIAWKQGFHGSEHDEDDADKRVFLLRNDRIGTSLLLVLFAGCPGCVHLREPGVGLRFGFDLDADARTMVFNEDADSENEPPHLKKPWPTFAPGAPLSPATWVVDTGTSLDVAQALLQNAFVAVFHEDLAEKHGSEAAPEDGRIPMVRKVRVALPATRQHGRG